MGSSESNKVKKLIRRKNSRKNLRTFITGVLVLIICGFFFLTMTWSAFYSSVVSSDKDMMKIVSITNENWGNQADLDKQISSLVAENAAFTQILYVNDNLETVLAYGARIPDFSDRDAYPGDPAGELEKKGILLEETFMNNVVFGRKLFSEIRDLFHIDDQDEGRALLDWAQATVKLDLSWIIYKTDIENVNVGVYYAYTLDKLHAVQFIIGKAGLIIWFFAFLFWGFIFNLLMIRRRRYSNRIVYTDPVTGGYNRDYFVSNAIGKLNKNRQYAVVQFRMEKYRNYCTAFGVSQGERLLERIYYCAKMNLTRKEKIAHLESADYALFLQYSDKDKLEKRLQNLWNEFNQIYPDQHLVFSAGICPVQNQHCDTAALLTSAGLALSKTRHINSRIAWFNDDMKKEQLWERRVEDDMEKALANREFQIYLQPKYSTRSEKLAAAEALVRWVNPELGFISPGKFIPIFETNGFILQLDDYMLREISRLQALWLKEGKKLVPISVNVSRAHFSMYNLAEHICSIVDEYNVPHKYIELELTESAFFDDKEMLLSTVRKLKKAGFRISMDDFGAGYSSLNSLKELPLDIIKLDAEFFRGIDDVNRANAIVSDTIALAKKLGMEIVAEGIETREQVDFLAGQNCDLIQGFYFAKPLPVSEFTKRAWG